jgi:hypothetical protein
MSPENLRLLTEDALFVFTLKFSTLRWNYDKNTNIKNNVAYIHAFTVKRYE